jgi:4-hydroxybenzoate polyprenyltransferase
MVSALWRSSHPGPCLVVTALAVILGLAASVPPDRLGMLALAVLLGQLSVGWSNDAIDARRDASVGRTDKPIARGEIAARSVWIAAGVAAAGALLTSVYLGAPFLLAHTITIVSAWSYNVWLKRTMLSVLPFIVSFGLLPSLATLAAASPRVAEPWAWIAGGAVGVAVHLTNVLPDLADDAATGVRGLPHRLGARASAIVAFVALLIGAASVMVGADADGRAPWILWLGFAVVAVVAVVGLVLAIRRPSRTVFRLVMAAGLLLALQVALATLLG